MGERSVPRLDAAHTSRAERFTRQSSKNSADLAIARDALDDLLAKTVTQIAVVSNDSDFGALFVKVSEMTPSPAQPTPFLWITVANQGNG